MNAATRNRELLKLISAKRKIHLRRNLSMSLFKLSIVYIVHITDNVSDFYVNIVRTLIL